MDALREPKLLKLEVRTPQITGLYSKSATTSLSNLCYNWFRERDANKQILFIDIHKCSFYNDRTAISMPKSIALDFYYGIPAEAALLAMKGITKLIADTPGIADGFVYVSV